MGSNESGSARALARGTWIAAFVLAAIGPASKGAAQASSEGGEVLASAAPSSAASQSEASSSRSVGVPDRGRLREAARLATSEVLRVRDERDASYGTAELVQLIERAAARVAAASPGAPLVVGDLSRERGGHLSPHRSHRSGRDADIGFYLVDEEGHSAEVERFVNLRRSGCGRFQGHRYCFDAARNWALAVELVSDPRAPVQYLMVAPDIRRRVLRAGEQAGAAEELLERVRTATAPHSGSRSHRSHFHIRIYCPEDDRPGCIDEPPYHDWYVGTPSPDVGRVMHRRARGRRAARRRAARRRAARRRAAHRRAAHRRAVRRRAAHRRAAHRRAVRRRARRRAARRGATAAQE